MPKLLIFDAFTLLIREKTVANYALLRCKTFSLKIWVCKIFDKFHVCSVQMRMSKYDVGTSAAIHCVSTKPNPAVNKLLLSYQQTNAKLSTNQCQAVKHSINKHT